MARFPWLMRYLSWGALIFIGAGPLIWFFYRVYTAEPGPAESITLFSVAVVGILIFFVSQIYMLTTEFGLTSQKIMFKRGIVSRYTNEIPLQSLENVNLHQSFFSRLFGFGRLEINGSGGSAMWTHAVQDPVSLRAAISEARIATENPVRFEARLKHIDQAHNHDRKP